MSDFDTIKVHDLVYLDNNDSLDFDSDGEIEGWHVVTGISQRVGFFTAAPLGDMDHSVYVDDMDIVRKHYSASGLLDAVSALIEIAAGKTNTSDGATVCMVMFEAQEIAGNALHGIKGDGA